MPIQLDGQTLVVESPTFTARFEGAALTSVIGRKTRDDFCRADAPGFPLELFYLSKDAQGADKHQRVHVTRLSELAARIVVEGDDSDRELFLRLDPDTGDLCLTPSGQSARRGVVSVRWNIPIAREAALVLPCVNGMLVDASRAFPGNDRFVWPWRWCAQLAIVQRDGVSLMVHSEDTACKFKALDLKREADGSSVLGFESEQVGPLWDNRAAGGAEWRLNVYQGAWRAPAERYREWLRRAYSLQARRAARPEWVEEIGFSVQWAGANLALLDALAGLYPPRRTLIHLARWRTSKYDVDYPDYVPSEEARAFLAKANDMGFRVMPHFNYFACYNEHPRFRELRDWQLRDAYRNEPQGWYWPPETYDYTRMAYIHPGLARWRRILINAVLAAREALAAPAVFIDQTLCTWNTDNGLVENMTTVEGMRQLQEELAAIHPDIVLAGEGLNEISFQRECFGQAHIHDGWGDLHPHHIDAAHNICAFLWEGHTRYVGYYHLSPQGKDSEIGVEVYRRMGALPSLIPGDLDPARLTPEDPIVRRILELATPP